MFHRIASQCFNIFSVNPDVWSVMVSVNVFSRDNEARDANTKEITYDEVIILSEISPANNELLKIKLFNTNFKTDCISAGSTSDGWP